MTSAQQLLGLRATRDKAWDDSLKAFTQALIYKGRAYERHADPAEIAERAGASSRVIEFLKADMPALSATGTPVSINSAFVDFLRNTSVVDAMSKWMVPAMPHTTFAIKSTAYTADEVGEGQSKPVQTATFVQNTTSPLKATAIVACTSQFLEQPVRNITDYLSRALRDAVASQMNQTFFENVEDEGASGVGSTAEDMGSTLADLRELTKMVGYGEASKLHLIVNSDDAIWLTSLAMSVGNGDMTPQGGRFFGMTVLVSDDLPSGKVFCVDPSGCAFWDGGVEQSISTQATLELEDAPANASAPTVAQASLTSLFQTGAQAFKVERSFAFRVIRPDAVASLVGVAWGPANDSPAGS
jgi:HK97 family phage major capsid protein